MAGAPVLALDHLPQHKHPSQLFRTFSLRFASSAADAGHAMESSPPLLGLKCASRLTRPHGAGGCEFVRIREADLQILHGWLESRCRFKKPLISVQQGFQRW